MDRGWIIALFTGVGIAAACGLRAFLPLLAVGVAARAGLIHLHAGSEWLAGDRALWALGVAAALEIAGDKIPVVDHALDAIGTLLRPVAASLVLGAGALAVHGAKAKTRLGSTALTLGHANPIVSLGEDLASAGLIATAILAPLLACAAIVLVVWLVARRRRRQARASGTA